MKTGPFLSNVGISFFFDDPLIWKPSTTVLLVGDMRNALNVFLTLRETTLDIKVGFCTTVKANAWCIAHINAAPTIAVLGELVITIIVSNNVLLEFESDESLARVSKLKEPMLLLQRWKKE